MNRRLNAKTRLAAAIALLWAGSACADMPAEVRTGHPRVLATQADLDRVRQEAAVGPLSLPAKKGKLVFKLTPKATGPNDIGDADVFGQQAGTTDRFYMRYTSRVGPAGTIALQVVGVSGGINRFVGTVFPRLNVENTIEFEYDVDQRTATVRLGSEALPLSWASNATWSPAGQQFSFFGHTGDRITGLTLTDNGVQTWHSDEIDLELHRSWRGFLANADRTATILQDCKVAVLGERGGCDQNQNGRSVIIEAAQRLTTAYHMTRNEKFRSAALKHIAYLLQITNAGEGEGRTKGGEWDMAARVGAMGLYYDWLYDGLGVPERAALAKAIRDTIAAKNPTDKDDDLVYSVCGYNQTVVTGPNGFDCAVKPTLVVDGWKPTIAPTYVSGHTQAANAGVALGLLAIGTMKDGNADVRAMLNTIYDHYAKGFWPARDFYSVNGGNPALFAYAVSGGNDTAERLVTWKRAMVKLDDRTPAPTLQALPELIYPYIYGLRADGTYPARSDYFNVKAGSSGEMAAAAMAAVGDPRAAYFYHQYVIPNRNSNQKIDRSDSGKFWERLLYPSSVVPQPFTGLPLSRHFRNAGNVLMRDTWNFAEATLLEFKSSSYITINHHHMDQNSYSLYYKAPLLLDSGQYDRYGSNHWHNYYIRSIAHNTVTVYESGETFTVGDKSNLSLDGGQWPGTREANVQLKDIQPGGKNALDGVVTYEEGGDYSYVTANAGKAYVNGKLDQTAGFLRTMVYLRPGNARLKPKVVVFDSVRPTKDGLEISSLLHSANKPTSSIAPSPVEPGRYVFDFKDGTPDALTIRNGDGMVTVQTLLPAKAKVVISGGKGTGDSCVQAKDPFYNKPEANQDPGDCRFLVRKKNEQGVVEWQNFAVLEKADNITMEGDSPETDMGAWRVEISPKVAPLKGSTQYFLNVLHVADSDGASSGAAVVENARVLSADGNAVAVSMADGQLIVFHDGSPAASVISWAIDPANAKQPTLVVGLDKNASYTLEPVGTTRMKLTRGTGTLKAPNGVLKINRS